MVRPFILLADGDAAGARELGARLAAMGYGVAGVAPSGPDAVRLAAETRPDLVLTEVGLGTAADGAEAAAEIRRRWHIPVVYLTARADPPTLDRVKPTEPFGYVLKPGSERELRVAIDLALSRGRTEARLRQVEGWVAAAIDETADAVVATDPDGVITHFNPAAEAVTGWPWGQAVGRPLGEVVRVVSRVDRRPVPVEPGPGRAGGPGGEALLVDRTGADVPVDLTTRVIRGERDRPAGIVAVFRRAAGRHADLAADVARAVAQAATPRELLQLCAESVVRNLGADLARVWTVTTTGGALLLQAGAGADTRLDGPHARLAFGPCPVGRVARDRRPYFTNDLPNDPPGRDPDWARREGLAAFAGHPLLVDDRLLGVMGMYSRRPLPAAALEGLRAVAATVAVGLERKQLEDRLRQSQKMEAVGLLAGGVAHDFNNLLTIINGYSEIIQTQLAGDSPVLDLVREIAQAGRQAATLTRQLLAFSRKQVLEPRVLDLPAVIADLENMLQRMIGEDIVLTTIAEPGVGRVRADPGQLEQILLNLVINARDAMPRGGRVTLEVGNADLDATYTLTLPDVKPGPYVLLAVSDTGVGMSEEVKARIFEPFFTTKEPGQGTGLGLATIYGIVRQSGGHIAPYSEPGRGTTFKIYLPRVDEPVAAGKSHHGLIKVGWGTETILLVEDEPAVRALARHVLQLHGYTVIEAGHGKEALRVAGEHAGPIHLTVTDVIMPGMSGRLLADQLTVVRPGVKVLYLSGYTGEAVVRHGVLEADAAFLQKPFTPTALAQKVRDVLDLGPV